MGIFLGSNLKGGEMLAHRRGVAAFAGFIKLGVELRMRRSFMQRPGFRVLSLRDTRKPSYDGLEAPKD